MKKKIDIESNRGITLIALVITIIVLLILAGVAIVTLTGENGLIEKTEQAREESIKAQLKEEIEMAILDIQLEEKSRENDVTLETLANLQLREKLENIIAELSNEEIIGEYKGYNYTIDKNFNVNIVEKTIEKVYKTARYLIIEVEGLVGNADAAVINEIQVYDKNINECEYSVLEDSLYDNTYKGYTSEWKSQNRWGYDNLNDGSYEYISNYPTGYQNCTFFLGGTYNVNDRWVRFIIDLRQEIEIGQVRVNIGGYDELSPCKSRTPAKVNIYSVNNFIDGKEDNSTYTNNIMKKDNVGLTLIGNREFFEIINTPTWIEYMEIASDKYINARHLLVDVNGYLENCDSAVINEIEVYNIYNEKIKYTILAASEYDSATNGFSEYWTNMNYWNYTNLNDSKYEYISNYPTGNQNCTLFLLGNYKNNNSWARFIINFNVEEKIKEIVIYVGGTDELSPSKSRMPKQVSFFKVKDFIDGTEENSTYNINIKQRNNENIELIESVTFNEVLLSPKKINILNTDI